MKMYGSTYADTLIGGKAKDQIFGDQGNDLISAWEVIGDGAADSVDAGAGNDLISGFSFNFDRLARSESRGASVNGGTGIDDLIVDVGGKAKTVQLGNMHLVFDVKGVEEIIYNFSGATLKQTLVGTTKGETIYGGENGTKILGGKGNDYLFSGTGDDVLDGGDGNDFLSAAGGRNELTGGKGADYFQFHITTDYSYSNITDFEKGVDKIALVLDTGGEFDPAKFGDELRLIDRPIDTMQYLDYDHGRIMDRGLFTPDSDYYGSEMVYEQSTGSFLQIFHGQDDQGDPKDFFVLLAHLDGKPVLDANDFVFMVL